jgi:hypothetical protein
MVCRGQVRRPGIERILAQTGFGEFDRMLVGAFDCALDQRVGVSIIT